MSDQTFAGKAPESIERRISQITKAFETGILMQGEASRLLFDLFSPDNVADVLKLIPEMFLADIKERVRRMPVSPWDWEHAYRTDYSGTDSFDTQMRQPTESKFVKPVGLALRSYYKQLGLNLYREDPSLPISFSFEEILELDPTDNLMTPIKDSKLSAAVAIHIFSWRKRGDQWECPKGYAADLDWRPTDPPTFVNLDDSYLPMLWRTLKYFHPWVFRDANGRGMRWADVNLMTYASQWNFNNGLATGIWDSIAVVREVGNSSVPTHERNDENGVPRFNVIDCANSLRSGQNFRIDGLHASEVVCRALLVAKKCRQEDAGPGGV